MRILSIFKVLFETSSDPEQDLTTDHLSKQLFRCVPKERNAANQELVQDNSHGPPIHRLPIALAQDHFWCNVLWSPTDLKRNMQESNKFTNCQIHVKVYFVFFWLFFFFPPSELYKEVINVLPLTTSCCELLPWSKSLYLKNTLPAQKQHHMKLNVPSVDMPAK